MPIFKVAILKSVSFKERPDEFANVYTVSVDGAQTDAQLEAMADEMVAAERLVFASTVSYVNVKVWDVGLAPNYMRVSKALTGFGSAIDTSTMYRECAIMLSAPLPRRQGLRRTIRRDLRKFLHTCSAHGWNTSGTAARAPLAAGDAMFNFMAFLTVGPSGGYDLCAPNGDVPTGPWVAHRYMEHRQFPRGRKES